MPPKRDKNGKFKKGTLAGPGRPPKNPTDLNYIQVVKEQVSLDKWGKVVTKALQDAIKGDARARSFLAEYLMGKPPTILELRSAEAARLREVINIMSNRFGIQPEEWIEDMYYAAKEHEAKEQDGKDEDES